MAGFKSSALLAVIVTAGLSTGASAQVKYSKNWSYHNENGYYYKTCYFPQGGHQYLIFYKEDPNWVYWYNPKGGEDQKGVYWCKCPTVKHPDFGVAIKRGEDLFLIAVTKAKRIQDTEFIDPRGDKKKFVKGTAKDKDGSPVNLECPPPDLPGPG